jgi:hypothetical protein
MAMLLRRLALLCCAALAACDAKGGDDDGVFRTTFGYFMSTGNTTQSGIGFVIISEADIDFYESQTGANQLDTTAFIRGQVQNAAGNLTPGVEVEVLNDNGLSSGQLYYQSAFTGAFGSAVPYTSGTGRFIVINVPAGRINLRCKTGADGNLFVQAVAGAAVFAQVKATAPKATAPTWDGLTLNLGGTGSALPAAAEPAVALQLMGATGTLTPSNLSGQFSLGAVQARNTFLMKATKTDFVPTYTYVRTLTANLTSGAGGGDVLIASVAVRDAELVPTGVTLTPGTGIIRGRVMDGAGGFAVEVRDAVDNGIGVVRYGDNGNAGKPNDALTATHPNGIFYVYNVPPGQVLLRAGRIGAPSLVVNTYVDVYADSITVPLDLEPLTQSVALISISGFLQSLTGFAVPEANVVFHGLGIGDETDVFGELSISNVPTQHELIVRSSK